MINYRLTLVFTNLDNFMTTADCAEMSIDIKSDSYSHAMLLAQRFAKVMDADRFDIDKKG